MTQFSQSMHYLIAKREGKHNAFILITIAIEIKCILHATNIPKRSFTHKYFFKIIFPVTLDWVARQKRKKEKCITNIVIYMSKYLLIIQVVQIQFQMHNFFNYTETQIKRYICNKYPMGKKRSLLNNRLKIYFIWTLEGEMYNAWKCIHSEKLNIEKVGKYKVLFRIFFRIGYFCLQLVTMSLDVIAFNSIKIEQKIYRVLKDWKWCGFSGLNELSNKKVKL